MREAIENLLEAAGFSAFAYASAESLLAGDRLKKALCIICNVKLPAMSGLELITELRAIGSAPPVILVSATDKPRVRNRAKRFGAAAYLAKPFVSSALLNAVDSVAVRRKLT